MPTSQKLTDAALRLAAMGFRVFPCHSMSKAGKCSCQHDCGKQAGKHPRTANGHKAATTDADQIKQWWNQWQANVAIATGNGLFVLDVDPRNGGDESFAELENKLGALPQGWLVKTGGGGRQFYCSVPADSPIRNRNGYLPGIDVRSNGGYVIAPPSNHASGGKYSWLSQKGDTPPELPARWVEFLTSPPSRETEPSETHEYDELDRAEAISLLDDLAIERCDDHDSWVQIGMILHTVDDSHEMRAVWDEWSQKSGKYDADECERRWASFKQGGGLGLGSLRYWALEDAAGDLSSFDDLTDEPRKPCEPGPIPESLLDVPGYINTRVESILETAEYPDRHLSFAAAMQELCTAAARKFTDPNGTAICMALVCIATTAKGKNHPRKCIVDAISKAGMFLRIGESFTSRPAIEDRIKEHPVKLYVADELGCLIKSMSNTRNQFMAEIPAYLNTLLTQGDGYIIVRDKAGMGGGGFRIAKPHLGLYGTATKATFYNAISNEMAEDGLYGRLIPFEGKPRERRNRNKKRFYTPEIVVDFLQYLHDLFPENNGGAALPPEEFISKEEMQEFQRLRQESLGNDPELWTFERCPYAEDVYDQFRDKYDDLYTKAERDGDNTACATYGRASEQCNQFALVYTISQLFTQFKEHPTCYERMWIGVEAIEWAIAMTDHVVTQKLFRARNRRSDSEFNRKRGKVIGALRGGKVKRRDLVKNSHLSVEELFGYQKADGMLGGVIGTMVQSGEVREIKEPMPSKNGRVARSYELIGKVEL